MILRSRLRVVLISLLHGFAMIAITASASDSTTRAQSILSDINSRGAKSVVEMLWADEERWNDVMTNVGSGDVAWLGVAVALRSGTDAGASEMLDEAISIALKSAPAAVLRLLKDHKFNRSFVCSSNIVSTTHQNSLSISLGRESTFSRKSQTQT